MGYSRIERDDLASSFACKLRYTHIPELERERERENEKERCSRSGLVIYSSHESRIRRDKANATLRYLFTDFLFSITSNLHLTLLNVTACFAINA